VVAGLSRLLQMHALLDQGRDRCKCHSMTRNGTPGSRGAGDIKRHKALINQALDSGRARRVCTRAISKSGFPVPFCAIFRATLKLGDGDYFDAVSSNSEAI
jgi:hypothetical protein